MKRSEMVENLACYMEESFTGTKTFRELANICLKYLEDSGMKPPCNQIFGGHLEKNLYNECNDYVESCNFRWDE